MNVVGFIEEIQEFTAQFYVISIQLALERDIIYILVDICTSFWLRRDFLIHSLKWIVEVSNYLARTVVKQMFEAILRVRGYWLILIGPWRETTTYDSLLSDRIFRCTDFLWNFTVKAAEIRGEREKERGKGRKKGRERIDFE